MPQITSSGPSDRVRIAQIAHEAALAVPGVVDVDSGPAGHFATVGGGTRVAGITSAAAPGGGYDVALRLVCEMTDLRSVADRVRTAVQAAARADGLTPATVTIDIVDVIASETA